jgi:3D-(3,5/4)-trihydroxycyclohexane-1,2-dione acylhydrolase (decyclizing)
VCDALEGIAELEEALSGYKAPSEWTEKGRSEFAKWNSALDEYQKPTNAAVPTYAQVVGVINAKAGDRDHLITAAGGLPGEVMKNWRVKSPNTFDCEFGFSCMGYEIAAGWGAAMADPTRTPIVMIGDGTYMMMNSDIYSSVLSGHKMILIVCDNGGYAVINRLQNAKGGASFNNLLKDCRVKEPFAVDFAKHAEAMGALTRHVDSLSDLGAAMEWAKTTDRTTVLTIVSDAFAWTPGDAWWDVGVPQVSERPQVNAAAKDQQEGRRKQRVGV